jgi:hypothetical protein
MLIKSNIVNIVCGQFTNLGFGFLLIKGLYYYFIIKYGSIVISFTEHSNLSESINSEFNIFNFIFMSFISR